jgi:hypothetical protein
LTTLLIEVKLFIKKWKKRGICMEARGTVEWDDRRVTVEGPAEFVSVELEKFRNAALHVSRTDDAGSLSNPGTRPLTEAALIAEKMPADHSEKIAVLAVKLKESGKEEFNDEDMRRAYLRASIKPPKVMRQALVDAKRHKDFIEPASTRGMYRLTHHGEDFVQFELPRRGGKDK